MLPNSCLDGFAKILVLYMQFNERNAKLLYGGRDLIDSTASES